MGRGAVPVHTPPPPTAPLGRKKGYRFTQGAALGCHPLPRRGAARRPLLGAPSGGRTPEPPVTKKTGTRLAFRRCPLTIHPWPFRWPASTRIRTSRRRPRKQAGHSSGGAGSGRLAQLVRASRLHREGHGFKSPTAYHLNPFHQRDLRHKNRKFLCRLNTLKKGEKWRSIPHVFTHVLILKCQETWRKTSGCNSPRLFLG